MTGAVLTTDRLRLRAPEPADAAACVAYYTSDRRARADGRLTPDAASERFADACAHWTREGYGRFVVEDTASGTVIGLIGPHCPAGYPEPELAWHIWSDAAEGQGYAFEAASAARAHAFETLGWTTAVSYIRPRNTRSRALAARLGATRDAAADWPAEVGLHHCYRHTPEARS